MLFGDWACDPMSSSQCGVCCGRKLSDNQGTCPKSAWVLLMAALGHGELDDWGGKIWVTLGT